MVINSLTILIVAGIGLGMYLSFRLGEEVGYDRGNAEGRKALRKQFMDQVNR
jgi:predicted membrane chloride channel (bestrophin family)